MSTASKIAVGVASGYLLGRTKKLKLAITVGSMLAGQRISTSPQGLLKQGQELLDKNPELQKLQDQHHRPAVRRRQGCGHRHCHEPARAPQ